MFFKNKPTKMMDMKIEGMTCEHCEETIKKTVKEVSGVIKVCHIDWKKEQACFEVEENLDASKIIQAIQSKGYRAEIPGSASGDNAPKSVGASIHFRSSAKKGEYDLLIIGAGSAGFAAAIRAAELGAKVGLIEGGIVGGTCVNVGCVPSKTLIRAAEIQHRTEHHAFKGIHSNAQKPAWSEIRNQKDELVSQLRQAKYVDVLKSYPGVEYIEGKAKVLKNEEIEISNGSRLKTNKVLITTGASSWAAPIPGLKDVGYLDSTSAMNLEALPKSMIVLGASAVGMELAQTFLRLGVEVTVIEVAPHIVPLEDPDIGEDLAKYLSEEGMKILAGQKILNVKKTQGAYHIQVEKDGKTQVLEAEQLLVATGRRPNTQELGLVEAGVEIGPKGHIRTNEFLQTKNPNIYAAGDCTSEAMFVYVSAYGGNLAADNALGGNKRKFDVSVLPKVTFTDPQVASVGLTEAQAREKGFDVISSKLPLEHVPRALAARDTRGFIKLIADKKTKNLLGAQILAPEGGELIEVPTLAIKYGITVEDLATTFFPYLTQSEGIKLATLMFNKDVSKLSCCAV